MNNLSEPNNYLIIQTAFLGDVVLALSMAEYIKQNDENSKVVFLTTNAGKPIAEECEFIDVVLAYDKRGNEKGLNGIFNLSKKLDKYNFVVVFTPHRSFRSTLLTRLVRSKTNYGFDKNAMSWLFKNTVKYQTNKHETIRNLSLVRAYWNDDSEDLIRPRLNYRHVKSESIVMAPGSVWFTKRWPEEKWAELILHPYLMDKKIILIGAKSDTETSDKVLKLIDGKHPNIENRTGKDDIKNTIQVISEGSLLISNDSAPQHIAGAVDTPVITIYGSTIPAFGFYPTGDRDRVAEVQEKLECRPCTDHGKKQCPIKTFDCMVKIEIDPVINIIKDVK